MVQYLLDWARKLKIWSEGFFLCAFQFQSMLRDNTSCRRTRTTNVLSPGQWMTCICSDVPPQLGRASILAGLIKYFKHTNDMDV